MGNYKNKRNNNNNHRHVFVKRCHPEKYKGKSVQRVQRKQESAPHDGLQGCRIINIQQLQQYSTTLSSHAVQCSSDIVPVGERRDGLASIVSSRCSKCGYNMYKSEGSKRLPMVRMQLSCCVGSDVNRRWSFKAAGNHGNLRDSCDVELYKH